MIKHFKNKDAIYILLGVAFSVLSMLPYLILGENSIITYHDQLDGEIMGYILRAKHLWEGTSTYYEIMNGVPSNSIAVPAPGLIIFFRLFQPFTAFMVSMALIKIVAFVSMFTLLLKITERRLLAFSLAIVFMMLPFYTVYGLCIPGQPIIWHIYYKIKDKSFKPSHLFLAGFYAIFSSLALVGYAVIICLGIFAIANYIAKRIDVVKKLLLLVGTLVIVYAWLNYDLVMQILGIESGFISHKSELVRTSVPIISSFTHVLMKGATYTECNQMLIVPVLILCVCFLPFVINKIDKRKIVAKWKALLSLLSFQMVISLICAVYGSHIVTDFLNRSAGILHEFTFDRFTWLMPVVWFVIFALIIDLFVDELVSLVSSNALMRKIVVNTFIIIVGIVMLVPALMKNDVRYNISKLIKPDYYMLTWKQLYATDIFEDISAYLPENKSEYRVASVGIYPSSALYNGFYCLDAYSNNYPVEYKHEFRKIIEKELDKSAYNKAYFDDWGNRCYILSDEYGSYCCIEKKWNGGFHDLEIDIAKLKEMGCKYLFSATWILNSEELNLKLVNDAPFDTPVSWFNIYVYEL